MIEKLRNANVPEHVIDCIEGYYSLDSVNVKEVHIHKRDKTFLVFIQAGYSVDCDVYEYEEGIKYLYKTEPEMQEYIDKRIRCIYKS
jgi:hypothetical protein